jgi:quaternary ammonium compound-resistance protein SugE
MPSLQAAWIYLICAGLFEIGWPVGLKMTHTPGRVALGVVLAVACMAVSGYLLLQAQKTIPMGTAYAVWTGIGAAGTFLVGLFFYGDPAGLLRILGVLMIVAGVATLKLAS